jgi:hypothetical protein
MVGSTLVRAYVFMTRKHVTVVEAIGLVLAGISPLIFKPGQKTLHFWIAEHDVHLSHHVKDNNSSARRHCTTRSAGVQHLRAGLTEQFGVCVELKK